LNLRDALVGLTQQLTEQAARFAVVGGLAASARGEVRFTRDVDVAVSVAGDDEAEALIFQLGQAGYRVTATVEQKATRRLSTARLRHPNGVVCDLIFATCGIEQEVVETASPVELFPGHFIPTASAEALLAMKVLSSTSERPRDLGDIQAILLETPEVDRASVTRLLELIQARGFARGQQLVEKWQELQRSLGV